MKKLVITAIAAAALMLCGLGTASAAVFPFAPQQDSYYSNTSELADFNAITCNVPCYVEYKVGLPSIDVYAPADVHANLTYVVKNGKLTVSLAKKKFYKLSNVVIKITSPKLSVLELNGAVNFIASDTIYADNFSMQVNGAGSAATTAVKAETVSVEFNGAGSGLVHGVECNSIKARLNGAGKLEFTGQTDHADMTINGTGRIDCKDLKATEFNSSINGIGRIVRE